MDEITRNADGFAVIHLANMRGEVLVDDEDWPNMMQFSWYIKPSNKTSYAQRTVAGKSTITMHQQITGKNNMDHINLNGLDNRRVNLREIDRSGNGQNQGERTGTTSRFQGVVQKENGKWQAQIGKDGILHHLGVYENEEDAARAYNAAAPLYYDGPKLNVVPDLPEGVTLESRRVLRHPDKGQPDPEEEASYFKNKYLGVSKRKNGTYQVQMNLVGRNVPLGYFVRPSVAAKAYNEAMSIIYEDPKLNQLSEELDATTCLDPELAKYLNTHLKENQGGIRKKQRGPSSSYKGVSKTKHGRFQAYVFIGRKGKYLGTFGTEIEAAKAYNTGALEHLENPILNDV